MRTKYKKLAAFVTPEMPDNIVPHPRYGVKIKSSKHELTPVEVRELSRLKRGTFWHETAIPANVSADRYGLPLVYVDRLCRCVDCFRPFVFYAQEQRYWVQSLGFHPDSTAVRCTECRRTVRKVKARRDRIEDHLRDLKIRPGPLTRDVLSDEKLTALTVDLLALVEAGAIKNLELLKRLRRAMYDRLERAQNSTFDVLVKRIDKVAGPTRQSHLNGASHDIRI